MALFLDPEDDEDEDAFGGGRLPAAGTAGRLGGNRRPSKQPIDPSMQQRLMENARRTMPTAFATGGPMMPMMGNDGQSFADNTMSAIQRENDSRVAQMREMRRLAAEQQSEQMKYDYLLRKLEVEREQMEKERIARRQAATGTFSRTFRNGQWEYT